MKGNTKDTAIKIGKRVTELRVSLGFSQAKLASDAGITPAAISQIESGHRTPSTPILRNLSKVLRVSTDYLLGDSEQSEVKDIVEDESVQKFFRSFKNLSEGDKNTIEKQIAFLKSQEK